ncbi:dehydrogenase, PQQ-dependent, s-GDH family [Daejeonella rubra]|uniref:Dehydrogenase, PQQ-dependent, s-GDH family n=1 Tax=Daejeonella rubra TaxID=990371 RepID=A0A1G9UFD4_9SPHI|nr:PQQ-dependent sugar dehydrogenase [Daejeonella rubra]SDM58444.1 dehydrogenase, PQQ-dependent, s-GDH family [Daejeonella rubra]
MEKKIKILGILILILASGCKKSSKPPESSLPETAIDIQVLTQNLSLPWELVWGPDNMIWMTERGGKVSRVNPSNGSLNVLITVPDVKSIGEGGLLGMALHPDFSSNPFVFLAYNYDKAGTYTEKIVRYTYNGTTLINPMVILDNIPAANNHNGARLLISPDLKLFISTGDAANQATAQSLNSRSGKILRINLDGTIPSDNPINGNPLWSYGHRNPQGLVYVNGKLYSSEHGPDKDDEINVIVKNRNYGWPSVNGFCNESAEQSFCNANNVAEPLKSWTPTIAVSGMDFYNNDAISQLKNSLILATLKDQTLYQLKLNSAGDGIEETKELFRGTYGRLRDVCVGADGKIYVATSNGSNDKIIVLKGK